MTTPVKRYTQPVVQTLPGPKFDIAEVPLFEASNGKWVRYEDVKGILETIEARCIGGGLSLQAKLSHALDCRDEWAKRLAGSAGEANAK